jgi:DASH complex subunit ASK1
LSGVEEREEDEDISYGQSNVDASTYAESSRPVDDTLQESHGYDQTHDSLLDDGDISGSTPRAPRPKSALGDSPRLGEFSSPFDNFKQEQKGTAEQDDDTQIQPTTPGNQSRHADVSMTPQSSPFNPTTYLQSQTKGRMNQDPLLHRVLDKNYRIQATPHKTARKQEKTPINKPSWRDDNSPMSSPPEAAPELHAEIFSSPIRKQYNAPRTPGISVQTPAKAKPKESVPKSAKKDEISWESDSDEDAEGVYRELGMSPPKTIQFNLPQSRLLQTPGKLKHSKHALQTLILCSTRSQQDDCSRFTANCRSRL